MTLTGTYSRSLDDKHRLAIPKRLRDEFSKADLSYLYLAPGTERTVCVYAPAEFDRFAERLAEKSPNKDDVRNYGRLFFAQAERVDLDSQSRMLIPERLVSFACLEREVVLLGVRDHLECWNPKLWQEFLAEHAAGFDEMAVRAFE